MVAVPGTRFRLAYMYRLKNETIHRARFTASTAKINMYVCVVYGNKRKFHFHMKTRTASTIQCICDIYARIFPLLYVYVVSAVYSLYLLYRNVFCIFQYLCIGLA